MRTAVKYISIAAAALLVVAAPDCLAFSWPWKKNKKAEATETPAPKKKTPYEKFTTKKGTTRTTGFVNLYKVGKEIWLEVPDSLMGREVILTSTLKSCSEPGVMIGNDLSSHLAMRLEKTDSMLLLVSSGTPVEVRDEDPSIARSFEDSRLKATRFAFPIKYRNLDSTTVVVKATKLFSLSNKSAFSLSNLKYTETVGGGEFAKDGTTLLGLNSFGSSVGALYEFSAKLNLKGMMGDLVDHPELTATAQTLLTLLDYEPAPSKKADSRIGTSNSTVLSFSSRSEVRRVKNALRWNLSSSDAKIRVYVDTLLSASYRSAVSEGIMGWDKAFVDAGLGSRIEVLPLSSDVHMEDPLVSCVYAAHGAISTTCADILSSGSTILSCRIGVPDGYPSVIAKSAAPIFADVDPRYLSYNAPDDAVCEYLKAEIITVFGQCLGLSRNVAGSTYFTPAQLRDPAFTQANGITGSVLDNNRLNRLAMPGDRERGVVTIVDRIGPYDSYAISWLYDSPSFEWDPKMLYLPSQFPQIDPRANLADFGSDPFAFADACREHARNIAEVCVPMLQDDSVPENYRILFLDWLWLADYRACYVLSSYVGGMYCNDVREGSKEPALVAVDKATQKKVMAKLEEHIDKMDELDSFKTLIHIAGANKSVSEFNANNRLDMLDYSRRLPMVAMSCRVAGSTYTPDDYLSDVEDILLRPVRKSADPQRYTMGILRYIYSLVGMNPVCLQNFQDHSKSDKSFVSEFAPLADYTASVSGVPAEYVDDFATLGPKHLRSLRAKLVKLKSSISDNYTLREIEYLIYFIDSALNK